MNAPAARPTKPDIDFIACLLLYSHRQDVARGFTWHSARTRGLLWYYGKIMARAAGHYTQAVFLKQMSDQNAARKAKLMKVAPRIKKPEKRRQVLLELQEIEQRQIEISKLLEKIADG